jgi:hypothetical protein
MSELDEIESLIDLINRAPGILPTRILIALPNRVASALLSRKSRKRKEGRRALRRFFRLESRHSPHVTRHFPL